MPVKRSFWLLLLQLLAVSAYCQLPKTPLFLLQVVNEKAQPVNGATVKLIKDDAAVKIAITNAKGVTRFKNIPAGTYAFFITYSGYKSQVRSVQGSRK